MHFSQLLARWDGVGIIVSKTPFNAHATWFRQGRSFVGIALSIAAVLFVLHFFLRSISRTINPSSLARALAQALMVILLATMFGVLYNWVDDDGMLSSMPVSRAIAASYFESEVPSLTIEQLRDEISRNAVTLLDARFNRDYQKGCIPGALNIPIDSSPDYRSDVLFETKLTDPIVIYCQSSKCEFAEYLSRSLLADGYSNVRIFPGGWSEWKKHVHEKSDIK
jgi:rhodanese-related sulfurtransferase